MAAPVGHIVCALALLHSNVAKIIDTDAFMAGTSFPDIRYVAKVERKITHQLKKDSLDYALDAPSAFEQGRRFHVFVDHQREKHMVEHDAYRFVKGSPWPTHMLKIVEDRILFDSIKNRFDPQDVFNKLYPEEIAFGIHERHIKAWHNVLAAYLSPEHWFNITRYYAAISAYKKEYGLPDRFFGDIWQSLKSLGFFLYAYYKIEDLSRNEELRHIILDFYEQKIPELLKKRQLAPLRTQ